MSNMLYVGIKQVHYTEKNSSYDVFAILCLANEFIHNLVEKKYIT